ncbi:MAG TPA: exodeoxyribonuclease VII small subunit [Clostridiales bacterium]|nr:exodeoxyribonuclease VII small subunit [Clostridiales bacterium]
MANKKKEMSFEEAVKELEQTVKGMESGDLGLDELLADFEKGIGLLRLCEKKLAEAEGRIEVLTKAETAAAPALEAISEENSSLRSAPPEDEAKLPF